MRTYNYLSNELPRELIEVYNDLQNDLLKIIVKELKQGKNPDVVFQKLRDKVDEYDEKTKKVIAMIFANIKKKAVKDGEKEFDEEDETKKPVNNNEANSAIAPMLIAAIGMLSTLNSKITNNATNEYTRDYQFLKAPSTRLTTPESKFNSVVKRLANKGLTIFEQMGGGQSKNYSIENILRRDIMYKVNQANSAVNMDNFKKSSAKFIEVSSHPTARTWNKYMKQPYEDHSSWQGKVYYSGEPVQGYEEFESTCGYGEMLGIAGINCYHQFAMNYDGESSATEYDKKEVEKNYALSQQQRQYERAIRQLKQARDVYESAGDELMAKAIGKNISMATNNLKTFCENNGLKYYNWRTQI